MDFGLYDGGGSTTTERPRVGFVETVGALLVLSALAVFIASNLDEPFDESGSTQRLFGALRPWSAILGEPDFRHPPLFFAFLKVSLRFEAWLGFETMEVFARLPAALGAWTAALLAWWMVRRFLGPLRAMAFLVILSASPPLLLYARDVGNLTLFMALVVATSALLCDLGTSRARLACLGALEVLMFYANHLAILVWAVQVATVAVHVKGRARKRLLATLFVSLALSFKPLLDLAGAVPVDMMLRDAARAHPELAWGEIGVFYFLRQALAEFVTLDAGGTVLVLLAGLGAVLLARRAPQSPFAFLHIVLVLVIPFGLAVATSFLRLQPSYLGFLAPSFTLLIVCGATGFSFGWRLPLRWSSAVGSLLTAVAIALVVRDAGSRVFSTSSMDGYRVVGLFLKSLPGEKVVASHHHGLATLIMYYGFEDPAPMVLGCSHRIGQVLDAEEVPLQCRGRGGTYVALSDYTRPGPETDALAMARFERLAFLGLWYVEDERYPSPPGLASLVSNRCALETTRLPVRLFRCSGLRRLVEDNRFGVTGGVP